MKVLLIGDVHLSDRPPSIRTESYSEDILAKLAYTVEVAKREDVGSVVFAGDLFHRKAPSRTSHALVQRMAEIVAAYPCPVFAVPGNHDVQHDRLDTLERQPLGVLFKAGLHPLIGQAPYSLNYMLFGVPWLYDWAADLPPYMKAWQECGARLMVSHAPIVPPGQHRPYEVIDSTDWAVAMGRRGDVYHGHMHQWDGAYQVGEFWFCNQGALSRGSLHEETLQRAPAVTLWDSDTRQARFTRIEVPHRPVREVFRLTEKEENDEKVERLDEFLAGVAGTSFERFSIEAVLAHVEELDLHSRTREVIREVLEEAMSR